MKLYWHKTPWILKQIYHQRIWDIPAKDEIYLTFDDGPHPEATPFVLEQLSAYQAKATFFCVGSNVEKYPDIVHQLVGEAHTLGNHTHTHMKGTDVPTSQYLQDVKTCGDLLKNYDVGINLFRPPYGRMTRQQAKAIKKDYRLIMWDYLIGDFDQSLSLDTCLRKALAHIQPGSIVIFHDSQKALRHLKHVLPAYLEEVKRQGLKARALSANQV